MTKWIAKSRVAHAVKGRISRSGIATIPRAHEANHSEIADFVELECLRRADFNVSTMDVTRIMEREAERLSQDSIMQHVREAINGIQERTRHVGTMGAKYPFKIDSTGDLVAFREDVSNTDKSIYIFLLLCTRLDMKSDRIHARHDASVLFEQLCSEVAKRLWGGATDERVKSIVFGTGRLAQGMRDEDEIDTRSFSDAVNSLCKQLNEGIEFDPKSPGKVTARDGKLDVVVWRSFSDCREGQLIAFGQCKTGDHWEADLSKLQPDAFFSKWVRRHPAVLPLRLYFISDRAIDRWYDRSKDAGVLLDRCRIMEYCNELPHKLGENISKWVKAAANKHRLRME